jgi:hypothetical protein
MATYQVTAADCLPMPASYDAECRHLGYDDVELSRPFAHYFAADVRPIQDHVREALLAGECPGEFGYEIDDAVIRLSRPGYHKMETGWARTECGTVVVFCHTEMPGVTAQMWDWWFGWHGTDSARYKLWYPDAHQFSAVGEDRSGDRTLTDRQRYLNNVSYVDEYIGAVLSRLTIRFVDPTRLGFEDRPGTTYISAQLGMSELPLAGGWVVHQVRPTDEGCEMRSRFFLGHPKVLNLPAHSVSKPIAARVLTSRAGRVALKPAMDAYASRATRDPLGHDLLHHCASEMNHLASFLPDLYAEFRDSL